MNGKGWCWSKYNAVKQVVLNNKHLL
jgi:hypothetical protein